MRILLAFVFLATFCLANCSNFRISDYFSEVCNKIGFTSKRMGGDNILTHSKRSMNESWFDNTSTPSPTRDPMKDNLYEIHNAFMFPGSYYLIDMLRKHVQYMMETGMSSEEMKDNFELEQCDVSELMKNLHEVSNVVYDAEIMALYATRMLIKPILQERMKCPASFVDVGFAKMLFSLRWNLMDSENRYLYDVFTDMLPKIDPELQPYIHDLAEQGVNEFHGYLFNKSVELLFTFGMRDVAFSSHTLYENLVWFFSTDGMSPMSPNDVENMLIDTVQTSLMDVWCPASYEIIENHRQIVMMLKNEFAMMESEDMCSKLAEFLYTYVQNNLPWHNASFENTIEFWKLCDTLKGVINDVTELFTKYDMFLTSMNIGDVETFFRKYLSTEEWEMFSGALRRLGFYNTVHIRSINRISSWLQKN